MSRRVHLLMLIITVLLILPKTTYGFQQRQERDSLRQVRDSLLNVIRIQDSLLLQASLDSLYWNNVIIAQESENDSLLYELRNMILQKRWIVQGNMHWTPSTRIVTAMPGGASGMSYIILMKIP